MPFLRVRGGVLGTWTEVVAPLSPFTGDPGAVGCSFGIVPIPSNFHGCSLSSLVPFPFMTTPTFPTGVSFPVLLEAPFPFLTAPSLSKLLFSTFFDLRPFLLKVGMEIDPLLKARVSLDGLLGGFGLFDGFSVLSEVPLVRGVEGEWGVAAAVLPLVAVLMGGGGGGGGWG